MSTLATPHVRRPLRDHAHRHARPRRPARGRARRAEVRHRVHRAHGPHLVLAGDRLVGPARREVRPAAAGPRDRRPALRAGDLRGPQGVPARRRLGVDVPPAGQRRAVRAVRAPARAAASCPRRTSWAPSRRSSRRTWPGCRRGEETSLYLRPFMYASETFLGVRPSLEAEFLVIASPVGPYFAGGVRPVSIWVDRGLPPRGRRRHGRRQVRRQLRREPAPAAGGLRQGLRAGLLPRRVDEHVARGARRDERLRRLRRRQRGDAARSPARSSRASRARRSCGCSRTRATRSPSARSRWPSCKPGLADGSVREVFACGTAAVMTPDRPAGQRRLRPDGRRRRRPDR